MTAINNIVFAVFAIWAIAIGVDIYQGGESFAFAAFFTGFLLLIARGLFH